MKQTHIFLFKHFIVIIYIIFFGQCKNYDAKVEQEVNYIDKSELGRVIPNIGISCDKEVMTVVLQRILKNDQIMRSGGGFDIQKDEAHQDTVVNIIEKCGMPDSAKVGKKGLLAIYLVLQHSNKYMLQYYFPMIKEICHKGELPIRLAATTEDRLLVDNNKPQIYGTQVYSKGSEYLLRPLQDTCKVDSLRKVVGMKPIREYLEEWEIKYDFKCQ